MLAVLPLWCAAQNLVPNGSFEEYTECPSNFSHIDYATGWMPFRVTPDYFNTCSPTDSAGVPLNILGYQEAATGFGYAGILCYVESTPPNGREFLGIALTQPLVPGVPVHLSFKTVFASSGPPVFYQPQFNCTGIGLRFAMQPFLQSLGAPVPNGAALHLNQLITDSVGWTLVEGIYLPDSAYQYLIIGNFFDDQSILVEEFDPNGKIDIAYFYVDDVCVTTVNGGCDFTAIHEAHNIKPLLWPNPFDEWFRVDGIAPSSYPLSITLSDAMGRLVWSSRSERTEQAIQPPMRLSEGTYIVTINSDQALYHPLLLHHQACEP